MEINDTKVLEETEDENSEEVLKEDKFSSFFNMVASETSKFVETVVTGTEKTIENATPFFESVAKGTGDVLNSIGDTTQKIAKDTVEVATTIKNEGLMKSKLRKEMTKEYDKSIEGYKEVMESVEASIEVLYENRKESISLVKTVEDKINSLANIPKEFDVVLKEIELEIQNFEDKTEEIIQAEKEVKLVQGGSSAGASLSALGVAVATLGPTAAMSVATTFGVASTGTAISALSGAAASNAALAWLGGGALAAGGGGTAAGSALLGLAGPVGWAFAGIMLTTSIGLGAHASKKNKEQADEIVDLIKQIEEVTLAMKPVGNKVDLLAKSTIKQIGIVENSNDLVQGTDYRDFSQEEKYQIGHLVNNTLSLMKLANEEVLINE